MLFAILIRTHHWLWSLYYEAEIARLASADAELLQTAVNAKLDAVRFAPYLRPFFS